MEVTILSSISLSIHPSKHPWHAIHLNGGARLTYFTDEFPQHQNSVTT